MGGQGLRHREVTNRHEGDSTSYLLTFSTSVLTRGYYAILEDVHSYHERGAEGGGGNQPQADAQGRLHQAALVGHLHMAAPRSRSSRKVEQIIREEMNRKEAQEILMPSVQPKELWVESGRWEVYGKELLRFKDRNDRELCLAPTHEEVITDLVRKEVRSYRELPLTLYQIQTKFRDEIRPRFGVMRSREFIMKDAYSFDVNEEGAEKSYMAMFEAYENIFRRCGLQFRAVEADTGEIGGKFSHEFMVLADTGEDIIISCDTCGLCSEPRTGRGGRRTGSPMKEKAGPSERSRPPAKRRSKRSRNSSEFRRASW